MNHTYRSHPDDVAVEQCFVVVAVRVERVTVQALLSDVLSELEVMGTLL